jgi:NADH:ubiquinone oxidoreductase subunit 3 (subunit A)
MKRILVTISAMIIGVFALVFSIIMAIPLTIAALIAGKKMQKDLKQAQFNTGEDKVIEGEYQDISRN